MPEQQPGPYLYEAAEIDAIEAHIDACFGPFENVLHESVSPDIHLDVAMLAPNEEYPCWRLVTLGMGAFEMPVPEYLQGSFLERAELVLALPADWPVQNTDESDAYWPIRLLKDAARMPVLQNSWLGWGHTIAWAEPFDSSTGLCAAMAASPAGFEPGAGICRLPGGQRVNFYQIVPLYRQEVDFKQENDAEALLDRLDLDPLLVLNPMRPNVCV